MSTSSATQPSRATQSELARLAGVSRWTINRALLGDESVNASTRERISRLAKQHNYRPSAAARAMRNQQTKHIGVLIRNNPTDRMTHMMTFETILGLNEGLEAGGYVLSIIRITDIEASLAQQSRAFKEHMLDGMITLCGLPQRIFDRLQDQMRSVVFVESALWQESRCIRRDEVFSGYECARRMIDLGYRDLLYIGHPGTPDRVTEAENGDRRRTGAQRAADEAGLELREASLAYTSTETFREMSELFRVITPQTGVIISQAYAARWFAHAAAAVGLVPPHHFGLACCDDGYDVSSMWPGLCRVGFDRFGLGVKAAEMMRAVLETPSAAAALASQEIQGEWRPGNTAWGPTQPQSYQVRHS